MRIKRAGCLLAALLVVGLVPTLSSAASQEAETGDATSITASSALLNGIVDPTYSDSVWFFEYSTSPTYATNPQTTKPVPVGATMTAVSATIDKLSPSTTYYFRVVVDAEPDTTQPPVYSLGNTVSFVTLSAGGKPSGNATKYGVGSLTSRSLAVAGKVAKIVMICKGTKGALCTAKVSLTATGAHGAKLSCGSGSFIASAPHTHTVRVRPSAACLKAIGQAKRHRLASRLTGTFTTHQSKLSQAVTLVG